MDSVLSVDQLFTAFVSPPRSDTLAGIFRIDTKVKEEKDAQKAPEALFERRSGEIFASQLGATLSKGPGSRQGVQANVVEALFRISLLPHRLWRPPPPLPSAREGRGQAEARVER